MAETKRQSEDKAAKAEKAETPEAPAAPEAEAQEPQTPPEGTYTQERLIAEADDFFGQPSHVVAGALDGSDKEFLSLQEAEKAINNFLETEVTVPPEEEN